MSHIHVNLPANAIVTLPNPQSRDVLLCKSKVSLKTVAMIGQNKMLIDLKA